MGKIYFVLFALFVINNNALAKPLTDFNSLFIGKSVLIKPIISVHEGKVATNKKSFSAKVISSEGEWTETRYKKNQTIKPTIFKIISRNPLVYIQIFKHKNMQYQQYSICNKNTAVCDYSLGYFQKGMYLGSSIGKMYFEDKSIFKDL